MLDYVVKIKIWIEGRDTLVLILWSIIEFFGDWMLLIKVYHDSHSDIVNLIN